MKFLLIVPRKCVWFCYVLSLVAVVGNAHVKCEYERNESKAEPIIMIVLTTNLSTHEHDPHTQTRSAMTIKRKSNFRLGEKKNVTLGSPAEKQQKKCLLLPMIRSNQFKPISEIDPVNFDSNALKIGEFESIPFAMRMIGDTFVSLWLRDSVRKLSQT